MRAYRRSFRLLLIFALLDLAMDASAMNRETGQQFQSVLNIPDNLAQVIDAEGSAGHLPAFIIIQDVHRHAEVQHEIAAILRQGHRAWDMTTVFVEGAFQEVPMDALRHHSAPSTLSGLVQEGRLSGAEMAVAMDRKGSLRLIGIEREALYKKNLRAYEAVQSLRDEALDELRTIEILQSGFGLERSKYDHDTLFAMDRLLRLKWRAEDQARYGGRIVDSESRALREALRSAQEFYQTADERSRVFLERSLRIPVTGPRVLVVGGYHTAKMAEQLRAEGKSFVVLAPRVTQPADDELYRERLQESISALKLSAEP